MVDANGTVFDLRVRAPDAAKRESSRAALLAHLVQRFSQSELGAGATQLPTFS
jgi:hypothetical protein